ncbi:YidC/Oxa1 family membrane protein insertase [Patescibacteria group bacterium]|nr:YidC/Oxa1 family membrane protein insertase [Patescibacteria group bacterium]
MIQLFNTILAEPLYNLLAGIFAVVPGHDLGVTIIILTIIIKAVLWPLSAKAMKSQRALQEVQPQLKELKEKFKDDKEGLAKAMMELYSKEKVSPFSSCLPLLLQLPIFFALYRVMRDGLRQAEINDLYSWVPNPGHIDPMFFGAIDLASPNIFLAVLAGLAQFWQARMMSAKQPPKSLRKKTGAKDESMLSTMNKQMVYFMPIMTVVIGATLPGGLILYWLFNNLLTIGQQYISFRKPKEAKNEPEKKNEDKPETAI